MLFNSLDFAIFLPIVFLGYWFLNKYGLRTQTFFLLISSYVFYGWWDWRFLSLIVVSSFSDYIIALFIEKSEKGSNRKALLLISLLVNLGLLGFFKYYNFFLDSISDSFRFFGYEIDSQRLDIVLPVGISFYTFQTLSYTIDVYRRKISPTRDFIAFFSYVSFFPQLVAGPIERARSLLPQFLVIRRFDLLEAGDGMRQILWGLFKKIVIADNCAVFVNQAFENPESYSNLDLFVRAVFFSFQIYGDFSGYSDIAIGTSKLFGFRLMKNFQYPYFSRDIAEFWRRWHISLTSWFRDYLYIPLGGSQRSRARTVLNVFIVFIVSGLWHGANWTFVIWGLLNAALFIPLMIFNVHREHNNEFNSRGLKETVANLLKVLLTFAITTLVWVFFRADTVHSAIDFLNIVFSFEHEKSFSIPIPQIFILIMFISVEWVQRRNSHGLSMEGLPTSKSLRMLIYLAICLLIYILNGPPQEFIYFQF